LLRQVDIHPHRQTVSYPRRSQARNHLDTAVFPSDSNSSLRVADSTLWLPWVSSSVGRRWLATLVCHPITRYGNEDVPSHQQQKVSTRINFVAKLQWIPSERRLPYIDIKRRWWLSD
jgi:hypothetical protein